MEKRTFTNCLVESGLIIITAFVSVAIILTLMYLIKEYGQIIDIPLIIIVAWLVLAFTQWIKQ